VTSKGDASATLLWHRLHSHLGRGGAGWPSSARRFRPGDPQHETTNSGRSSTPTWPACTAGAASASSATRQSAPSHPVAPRPYAIATWARSRTPTSSSPGLQSRRVHFSEISGAASADRTRGSIIDQENPSSGVRRSRARPGLVLFPPAHGKGITPAATGGTDPIVLAGNTQAGRRHGDLLVPQPGYSVERDLARARPC